MAEKGFSINITKRLGEMLVSSSLITAEQLNEVLEFQRNSGGRLGQILIHKKYITEHKLLEFLSKQFGIEFVEVGKGEIPDDLIKIIPENIARRHTLIAVEKKDNVLKVAMEDPLNIVVLDDLKMMTGFEIRAVFGAESEISAAIDKYYGTKTSKEALDEILKKTDGGLAEVSLVPEDAKKGGGDDIGSLEDKGEAAPIVQMVNLIIASAIRAHASDIHIEPTYKETRVRFRIDGVLHAQPAPPKKFHNAIISRLKIMASLDISERRLPQDGRTKLRIEDREIDLRVSILPCGPGEKVVMRILDKAAVKHSLDELGFDGGRLAEFKNILSMPHGIVLVTGPTGSGKSTTLYSALNYLKDPTKNITTVEDPVEYRLAGINQIQVKPEIKLDFARCLRSILRQDPDIILIGEMRDAETVSIAIKASLTGHLVLSTFHTNDAPSTISRFLDMNVEPFLLASTVRLILAQRLVRRICDKCKQPAELEPALLKRLNLAPGGTFYQGAGCSACGGTGYKGRLPIFEFLPIDHELAQMIVDGKSEAEIRSAAREKGRGGLLDSGIEKMTQGLTTADEVLRVAAE